MVVKTDGWQGYSFLDALPYRHEWLAPGSGKEAPKVLPWVHTLIANSRCSDSMEMPLFWRPISQISQNHLLKEVLVW